MSNRTMQQKALKLRKQRRAMPKYLMKSGIIPNRGVLGEYKERAKGLGVSEDEINLLIQTLYKRDVPVMVSKNREKVLELLRELKQRVPEMLFFSVVDTPYYNTLVFFNIQKTCFVMAESDLRKEITRRSIEYGSKDRIMQAYYSDKIVWISCTSIKSG